MRSDPLDHRSAKFLFVWEICLSYKTGLGFIRVGANHRVIHPVNHRTVAESDTVLERRGHVLWDTEDK